LFRKLAEAVLDASEEDLLGGGGGGGGGYPGGGGGGGGRGSPSSSGAAVDVYVSYDRSRSAELASLIQMQLQLRGLSVRVGDARGAGAGVFKHVREAKVRSPKLLFCS